MVAHIKSKVVVVGGGGQLSFRWLISDEANPSCNKKTKESVEMKKKFNPQAGIEFTAFHLPDGCLTVGDLWLAGRRIGEAISPIHRTLIKASHLLHFLHLASIVISGVLT